MKAWSRPGASCAAGRLKAVSALPSPSRVVWNRENSLRSNSEAGLRKVYPSKPLKVAGPLLRVIVAEALRPEAGTPVSQDEETRAVLRLPPTRMSPGRSRLTFRRLGFTVSTWRLLWKAEPPTFT